MNSVLVFCFCLLFVTFVRVCNSPHTNILRFFRWFAVTRRGKFNNGSELVESEQLVLVKQAEIKKKREDAFIENEDTNDFDLNVLVPYFSLFCLFHFTSLNLAHLVVLLHLLPWACGSVYYIAALLCHCVLHCCTSLPLLCHFCMQLSTILLFLYLIPLLTMSWKWTPLTRFTFLQEINFHVSMEDAFDWLWTAHFLETLHRRGQNLHQWIQAQPGKQTCLYVISLFLLALFWIWHLFFSNSLPIKHHEGIV